MKILNIRTWVSSTTSQPDCIDGAHQYEESYYGFTCKNCGDFLNEWAFDYDQEAPIEPDEGLDW